MKIYVSTDEGWKLHLDRTRNTFDFGDREAAEAVAKRLSYPYREARVVLGATPGAYIARFRDGREVR